MSVPPAGWYPDGAGATRWWDGTGWTGQVQTPRSAVDADGGSGNGRAIALVALALAVVAAVIAIAYFSIGPKKPPAVGADCASLATLASGLNGVAVDQPRLQQLTGPTLVQDNTKSYEKPPVGTEPALVYSCRGLGSFSDGTQAPTLVRLTYSPSGTYLVTYGTA